MVRWAEYNWERLAPQMDKEIAENANKEAESQGRMYEAMRGNYMAQGQDMSAQYQVMGNTVGSIFGDKYKK